MKRKIILLSALLILLSGCSVVKLDESDFNQVVETIIKENSNLQNTHFEGYKYYLPKGFRFINKKEFNQVFSDRHNNKYYLYVDVVSYYHRVEKDYVVDNSVYFSKKLNYEGKFGYIEINEIKDKYFIEAMYNYAKIEVYISKQNLSDALSKICLILSTINYNDKILESLIGDNVLNYKEETFDIFESKNRTGSGEDFLKYVEEYDRFYDKNNEMPDEDNLDIDKVG